MILGTSELKRRIREEKLIENLEEKNIGGAGVDIRVGKFFNLKSGAKITADERVLPKIEEIKSKKIILKPQEYILIQTIEKVNMPPDLCAHISPRSSFHRSGLYQFHSLVDPGYHGVLTFGMKNMGKFDFEIELGARIAQIVFVELKGDTKQYEGIYQGGKAV